MFAVYCTSSSTLDMYAPGHSMKSSGESYVSTDTMQMKMGADGIVSVSKNGAVFYTFTTPNTEWPLFVAATVGTEMNPSMTGIVYVAP